jgi:RNA polymerase sigma-70 factor (ECF subfamily)
MRSACVGLSLAQQERTHGRIEMHQQSNGNETIRAQREVVNALFAQHYEGSLRVAHRILRSREDAEDAVQTAYCAAFRKLHAFRGEASFKTWITRIVVNACLAQMRKRRARSWVALDNATRALPMIESHAVTPETLCCSGELQDAHVSAASRLPQHLQDVYVPCAISGLAVPSVAHHLGLTVAAAKARLFRARRKVEISLQSVSRRRAA